LGVLTGTLIERGADVMAIEQDRRFISYLEKKFPKQLLIVHGDAAKTDWDALVGSAPWKFVSNLPYSITSLALRKALWSESVPEKIVVLVQREVAERAVTVSQDPFVFPIGKGKASTLPPYQGGTKGGPRRRGKTSLLSLMVAFASSSAKIVKRVPAGCFYPAPKVESAILEVVPMTKGERKEKWGMDPEKIMALAKKGFAHPRKLLASNLGINQTVLFGLVLNPKAGVEDLSPDDWAKLALALSSFRE